MRKFIIFLILSVFLLGTSTFPNLTHAQTPDQARPENILISATTGDNNTIIHQLVYGPSGGKPLKELAPDYLDTLTNPNDRWTINYQADKKQYLVVDVKTNTTIRTIAENQYGGPSPSLSPSTRYLTYTEFEVIDNGTKWTLYIVDLSTNKEWQFSDTYTNAEATPSNQNLKTRAVNGMPVVGDWNNTETLAILYSIIPFSDAAGFRAYFVLDISALPRSDQTGTLPPLHPLPGDGLSLSPDGTQAAVLSANDNNPARNFVPEHGSAGSDNTISVINLTTFNTRIIATAPIGGGVADIQWAVDGKRLYFIAGQYASTAYIVRPTLNYFDFTKNAQVNGTVLFSNTDRLNDLTICDGNLYYSTVPPDGLGNQAEFWVASLTNLKKRTSLELPVQDLYYTLEECVAS